MATYTKNTPGKPTSGRYTAGQTVQDSVGIVWHCIQSGIPGQWAPVVGGSTVGAPLNTTGLGTKNGSTVSVVEYGSGNFHQTVLTLTATPISITDEAGISQWGGVKVYTFPAGAIHLHGAVIGGNLTLGTTGTITDTFASVNSLGSVVASATGAATLVTTAATWLQQSSGAAAVAKVAAIDSVPVATQLTESGARHYDGTTTAGEVYLNFKVVDEGTHTSGTGSFTGTITLTWSNLGDN